MPNLVRSVLAVIAGICLSFLADVQLPESLIRTHYLSSDLTLGGVELLVVICLANMASGIVVATVAPGHAVRHYAVVWAGVVLAAVVLDVTFRAVVWNPVVILALGGACGMFGSYLGSVFFGKE